MLSRTSFSRRWGLYEAPRPASPASRLRRVYRSGCPRHRQSHRPLPGERGGEAKRHRPRLPSAAAQPLGSPSRDAAAGEQAGGFPAPVRARERCPARPSPPSGDRAPRSPAGLSLLAGEADPLLLTGDWRSRCPASPSSALGSCAAGLMLGTGRGSRSLARIHAGSSTTTRRERSAFSHQRGFSPPPALAHGAQPPPCRPRPRSRRDPTARRLPPGPGSRGARDTGAAAPAHSAEPPPSVNRAPAAAAAAAARAGGPGPARLFAPRAHTRPRMPFQIWRGWPDSVKGGVGFRR